jgi:hypothetical protein
VCANGMVRAPTLFAMTDLSVNSFIRLGGTLRLIYPQVGSVLLQIRLHGLPLDLNECESARLEM